MKADQITLEKGRTKGSGEPPRNKKGGHAPFGSGAGPCLRTEADTAGERIGRVSGLEFCAGDAALPDDRKECADGKFWVIRNRDCDGPRVSSMLHHHMTAASSDLAEAASKRVMNTSV